jgi:hypothetical protein
MSKLGKGKEKQLANYFINVQISVKVTGTVYYCRWIQMFWRYIVPQSSGSKQHLDANRLNSRISMRVAMETHQRTTGNRTQFRPIENGKLN